MMMGFSLSEEAGDDNSERFSSSVTAAGFAENTTGESGADVVAGFIAPVDAVGTSGVLSL